MWQMSIATQRTVKRGHFNGHGTSNYKIIPFSVSMFVFPTGGVSLQWRVMQTQTVLMEVSV